LGHKCRIIWVCTEVFAENPPPPFLPNIDFSRLMMDCDAVVGSFQRELPGPTSFKYLRLA
jgi:hypothetical protein